MGLITVMLGGCGSSRFDLDPTGWFSNSSPSTDSTGAEGGFTVFKGSAEAPTLRAVTPADLVGPDGRCEGAPAAPAPASPTASAGATASTSASGSAPAVPAPGGIGLTMTECQLVAVAGAPEQINIGAESGNRRAVLTYTKGDHPGIYTFVSGRLKVIERAPEPAKPERRRRTKKQRHA
jgi:hypothetical protein